jgi:FkbM family methyltransferase
MDAKSLHQNKTRSKDDEISELRKAAEFHAFSVRQVTAQRARLFELFRITGKLAVFDHEGERDSSGGGEGLALSRVLEAIEKSPSQFYQDIFCLLLNRGKRNGFFVEFGACDGLLISNTLLLEREFGWNGILSEPARTWQSEIQKNRSCMIETRCVWAESGKQIEFAEFSTDDYKTQSGVLGTSGNSQTPASAYRVETISLFDMLRQHGAPSHIDFMSIDTEGSELDILKPFPFDKYSFSFIAVEHHTPQQEAVIKDVLETAGYKQILRPISGHDGFYVPATVADLVERRQTTATDVKSEDPQGAFWEQWYEGKKFTTDWSSRAFPTWIEHLSPLRDEPLRILEIGAWEGRGSIFLLNFFPKSQITCVDVFMLGNEALFDANVMDAYTGRVEKLAARSTVGLDKLATSQREPFDLIYVDGSHDRDDVMMDSILAWRLLRVGGVLIWDDYGIVSAMPGHFIEDQNPKPAIDAFLSWRKQELEVLHSGYQVIVKKLKPHHPANTLDPEKRKCN